MLRIILLSLILGLAGFKRAPSDSDVLETKLNAINAYLLEIKAVPEGEMYLLDKYNCKIHSDNYTILVDSTSRCEYIKIEETHNFLFTSKSKEFNVQIGDRMENQLCVPVSTKKQAIHIVNLFNEFFAEFKTLKLCPKN